ncbi:MAG TPA: RdgB/HAM1 family non-canonical purine NTP pyrophosphatase [Candidatus Acidoferrales bacterium]|nr:RdgB/HAM1 family non-canonical purine NTP pyrophosphatase [Candidatus Acidoferrales bacterium]
MRFVLATFNRHKAAELGAALRAQGGEAPTIVPLSDWPGASAPEETGVTLEENARLKARAALALTGLPALADDTGLEVDALGGAPGVHSARYAGEPADPAANIARLLAALAGVPRERRTARFRTVCVAAFADGRELAAEGRLDGAILETPRGRNGFGYDPVFGLPDGRSLAELDADEKNRISHRARAIAALSAMLRSG